MKALTIGGAMIDTIAIIENAAIERMALLNAGASFLLLEEGRKTEALEVSTHCGGGAINTAVTLARLGWDCAALIKLGEDRRAEEVVARLLQEGISIQWVSRDATEPTGASVHVSSHDRNAAVFTFRGANTRLAPADLADEAFGVDLVYSANLSNDAARCFPVIVAKARSRNARVAANPGIRQLHAHAGAFQASLPSLDILALNRREATEVVSMLSARECDGGTNVLGFPDGVAAPALAKTGLTHGTHTVSVRAFLRALIGRGVGTVVLTDGRDGAFAATADAIAYCPAHEASVAGTAGAGDAFAATFAAYTVRGEGLDAALRAASVNAASVLGHVDTQTGLLRQAELDSRLAGEIPAAQVTRWPM